MISAEAPILFAKGCEIFISELTQRAWIHAEENKRRTLQRSDIANAISKTDMCDFLIDIVPREEVPKLPMRRAKDETPDMYDPNAYAAYYPGAGLPQYAPGQPIDPAYYQQVPQVQLTPDQIQQYYAAHQYAAAAQAAQQQQQQQQQQQASAA
ncbi:histone-fold-containing protein, partial [Jimgerdemannia flammicorona]